MTSDVLPAQARLDAWRDKLIDTSFKNRLLNFKETRGGCVHIVDPEPSRLLERFAIGHSPSEIGCSSQIAAPKRNRIFSDLTPEQFEKTMIQIRTKARSSIQEQGVNILFLAIGMIYWKESERSEDIIRSPLILIPVTLHRSSPISEYMLERIEEPASGNITLQRKLLSDLSIHLPDLEVNMGLDEYIDSIKNSIKDIASTSSWEIKEESYLGLFSFAKISMFDELGPAKDKAISNPIIRSIAGDPSAPSLTGAPLPAGDMDDWMLPAQTHQVLDADSSQQEAIALSKQGASFVLQGPPGTGKSQTIANIIGEALWDGRKVLFVSEKMAALEVVKGRLDECGLGDYCLELHSYKSTPSTIIQELARCMSLPLIGPFDTVGRSQQLISIRNGLNDHVKALHEPRTVIGMSVFKIYGELASVAGATDIPVEIPDIEHMGPEQLVEAERLVKRIMIDLSEIAGYDFHPWNDCLISSWEASVQAEILDKLRRIRAAAFDLKVSISSATGIFGGNASTLSEVDTMESVIKSSINSPRPRREWFVKGTLDIIGDLVAQLIPAYQTRAKYMEWLGPRYNEGILSIDAKGMADRFDNEYTGLFKAFNPNYKVDMATVRSFSRADHRKNFQEVRADLNVLIDLQSSLAMIKGHEQRCGPLLGDRYFGKDTDWNMIIEQIKWVRIFLKEHGEPLPGIISLICEGEQKEEARSLITMLDAGSVALNDAILSIKDRFLPNRLMHGKTQMKELLLDEIISWADEHLDHASSLQEWAQISGLEKECRLARLGPMFDLACQGRIPQVDLLASFHKRYYTLWLDTINRSDVRLRGFNSVSQEETIKLFCELDKEQMILARKNIVIALDKRKQIVLEQEPVKGSEIWVLRHETQKKKRLKPIRMLFSEAAGTIQGIKPCLLMSPLSVSKFLDPDKVHFDLVIFDEASQMRPEDAIGSIIRGSQLIVVGDRKQLPPTDFFQLEMDENEDDDGQEDLESILDECSAVMTRKMLLWHYRSLDESLIAFSNYHFYDGQLNTFPSSLSDSYHGVELIQVPDGVYDRGKSRRNVKEAKKVIDLAFKHYREHPSLSLGIVAFSEAQQTAIEEALEHQLKEEPEMESFFKEGNKEEFFIKNLESVQGDERDVMIFSVGYGKDASGKLSMNFGPLNRSGGERRLNVAITRARRKIQLVTSISPDDISKTTSTGAALLCEYMHFAASHGDVGTLAAIGKNIVNEDSESPFEEEVYRALTEKGLELRKQVGCSGYRIDMAVVDPEKPGRYALGIECDGASYHSARTARDRDRLREERLKTLGWKIHRIWSRDWIADPNKEIDKVISAVGMAGMTTKHVNDMPVSLRT